MIDESLLKIRNNVAHWKDIPISKKDFLNCYKQVIELIEHYRDLIINATINKESLKK